MYVYMYDICNVNGSPWGMTCRTILDGHGHGLGLGLASAVRCSGCNCSPQDHLLHSGKAIFCFCCCRLNVRTSCLCPRQSSLHTSSELVLKIPSLFLRILNAPVITQPSSGESFISSISLRQMSGAEDISFHQC